VLADSVEQLSQTAVEHRVEWLEIAVRRARPLAHSSVMNADTPIHLFVFEKQGL
jgi:hypothetical protein